MDRARREFRTVPALINLEWLLGMYEQRQDVPEAGEGIEIQKSYLRQQMVIPVAELDIIQDVEEEQAEEFLQPLSHLGCGELMDANVLMEQFLKESGVNL